MNTTLSPKSLRASARMETAWIPVVMFVVMVAHTKIAMMARAQCVTAPSGMVAWWQGEGNRQDVTGLNPGTLEGNPTFAPGKVGQSFSLDGGSDIHAPASSSLNVGANGAGLTVEGWVKPGQVDSYQPLVEWESIALAGGDPGVSLAVSAFSPGDIYAAFFDSSWNYYYIASSAGVIDTNDFHHVALTYDPASGLACLYVNGEQVAAENLGNFTPLTDDLYLGLSPVYGIFYQGLLDDVSVYQRPLSPSEIATIYNASFAGKCGIAPSIVSQPPNQTVMEGTTAMIQVVTAGTSLAYQWYFNGAPIAGATQEPLTLTNVQLSQAGAYSVVVTNSLGSVQSSAATLTVTLCLPAPAGLVACWEGEANAQDATGLNPGTVLPGVPFTFANGNVSFVPGKVGQAFSFDGGSAVYIPRSPSLDVGRSNAGFTVECWIKPGQLDSYQPLVEWESGAMDLAAVSLAISQNVPGDINASFIDENWNFYYIASSGAVLNTNDFFHVALTYDPASGVACLYLNGALVAAENLGSFISLTDDVYLGWGSWRVQGGYFGTWTYSHYYQGLLDEVSVYQRPLSASEIASIYNASTFGKCPP